MAFIQTAVAWFLGLGSTVIVPIVLILLGTYLPRWMAESCPRRCDSRRWSCRSVPGC